MAITGHFDDNNLKVYGAMEYTTNPDKSAKEYFHGLRGVDFYKEEFETGDDEFHISSRCFRRLGMK